MTVPSNNFDSPKVSKELDNKWLRVAEEIYHRDPAATCPREVYDLYPGLQALRNHEVAHLLYQDGEKVEARRVAEQSRHETGIEIHPGAQLADSVFIDHGMGVVIGETAIVGEHVKMYHGVTLGGTGAEKNSKRHPTIEDHVEIGAHAIILGDVTIGHHAKIGAGAVVLKDVPPYATAVGVPARIIEKN